MKKYLFLIALAGGLVSGASATHAQSVFCPYGYTCTPIVQQQIPVSCPFGYTCTPINGNGSYPTYPGNPTYPTYPTYPTVPPTTNCYTFNIQLSIGSSGNDVANLQSFLMTRGFSIGYISSGVTQRGYFGVQTAAALSMYQQSVGLQATGVLDSATRSQVNNLCGNSGNNGNGGGTTAGPFRITSPNGGESWQTGTIHSITWTSPYYFAAAYADIKLLRQYSCTTQICPMIAYAPYTIATGLPVNQNSYQWTVGNVTPLMVTNSSYQVVPDGQYTVQICQSGTSNCDSSDSTFTIYTSGNGNPGNTGQAPVINGIDAPTTLTIGQTGTWTVHAADPLNGTLTYSVDWGDWNLRPVYGSTVMAAGQFSQTTTFSHSYNSNGVYTITFTVRNNAGLSAQSKVTVNVGTTANNQLITVTSPNGGEVWQIGTQKTITWTGVSSTASNYNYVYNQIGTVRITLNQQCPSSSYCSAIYQSPYIILNSAPNSGSSVWMVGTATLNGVNAVSVPAGTYSLTVCRYDNSTAPTACDNSDSYFTLTN